MGNNLNIVGFQSCPEFVLNEETWKNEWILLKQTRLKPGSEEATNNLTVKYEEVVLYESDVNIIVPSENIEWLAFVRDLLYDPEDEEDRTTRVYSVLVHNFIYFFKSKNEYEKTLKSEFPPKPPLAIDLSSDEVEVHPKGDRFGFFRTIEKDLLCELTDKDLGPLLVEISSNRPEQRNTQPSFLHSIPLAKADGEVDGESEEHDSTDGEEVSVHFGDMSHLAEIPNGLSYGVYKAGSLIFKDKRVFCSLGYGLLLFYRNEESFKNIHSKPFQVIDLENTSFEPTEDFLENEFPYLGPCINATKNDEYGNEEDSGSEHSDTKAQIIDPKTIVLYVDQKHIFHRRRRKYTLEAETQRDGVEWRKSIELMMDYLYDMRRNSKHCVPVSDVLNSCRTGDLLLMKGKKISCRLIRAFTRSEYDHVAMLYSVKNKKYFFDATGDGVCMHTLSKFIRKKWYKPYARTVWRRLHFLKVDEGKDPSIDAEYYQEKLDKLDRAIYSENKRIDHMPKSTMDAFTKFASNNIGKTYSLNMQKVWQATGRKDSDVGKKENKEGMFCSELIASSFIHADILPSSDVHAAAYYYPGSFSEKRNIALNELEIDGVKYIAKLGKEFEVDWEGLDDESGGGMSCLGSRS